MTFGWPLRIVVLIGALFLIQSLWSISRVSVSPLPVNHNMPKFSDIDLSKAPRNEDYQNGVRRGFEGVKRECTAATLGEFAHAITWFYIDAVETAKRVGVANIEELPSWGVEDRKIDNYVAALAQAGVLKREHFTGAFGRAEGRIPLSPQGDVPHDYPAWAKAPASLNCPRA